MKRSILMILASLVFCVCNAQNSYTITGSVDGVEVGNIYVLKVEVGMRMVVKDTVAVADIKDGKFEMKGHVNEPVIFAVLSLGGQQVTKPFVLENENYKAKIGIAVGADSWVEGGGAEQAVFNQLCEIQKKAYKKSVEFQQEASQAKDRAKLDSLRKCMVYAAKDKQDKEFELVKANPDSYIAGYVATSYTRIHVLSIAKDLYNSLSDKGKATEWGRQVAEDIAYRERTDIGATAEDFSFVDQSGKKVNLYDVKGKVKLVVFWNTVAPMARQENLEISTYYREFHDKGLEVISVSLDKDKARWAEIVKEDNLPWMQGIAWEKDGKNVDYLYRIGTSYPLIYILDENNQIIDRRLRREQLKDKLSELLS